MRVLVSAAVCIGACVSSACCGFKNSMAKTGWAMHNKALPTSKAEWEKYFNDGGDI
jgi:hypothetical protein|tara:strand:- start:174 stop:341 length:168 start_codon:yes stop_codon:yes gene_type:complete